MSFKTIDLDEYRNLLKNKKKMFDLTFGTPEVINRYRDDDDKIDKKFYMKKKSINKIKIYLNCLIKT